MLRTPALVSQLARFVSLLALAVASSCAAPVSVTPQPSGIPVIPPAASATASPIRADAGSSGLLTASGIRIEEHALLARPELEPLSFTSVDGRNEVVLMREHASVLHQRLRPESYYALCGCNLWIMQAGHRLETATIGEAEGGTVQVAVLRDGQVIFSTPNDSPGVTSEFRVLTTYDDHWVLELAQRAVNTDGSTGFAGRVFVDGQSLNEQFGYDETFGFQTMAGMPFYFYRRAGQLGVVADGQDVPLQYDEVPHYGCCSAGELNPRIARNMIAFFARRGNRWYYVEIGAFDEDR